MDVLEESILSSAPDNKTPAFYRRFIDDCFGRWVYGEKALVHFVEHSNNAHPNIRFTYQFGRCVSYLDTTLRQSTAVQLHLTSSQKKLTCISTFCPQVIISRMFIDTCLGVRLKAIVSDPERLEARFSELSAFLLFRG